MSHKKNFAAAQWNDDSGTCPMCGCVIANRLGPNEQADILGLVEFCDCDNGPDDEDFYEITETDLDQHDSGGYTGA